MTTAKDIGCVWDDGLIFTLEPVVAAIEEAHRQATYAYKFTPNSYTHSAMMAAMTALTVIKGLAQEAA